MNVQLNTTTPNVNFKAKFSKKAEAHINKELKHLEQLSHDEMYKNYYTECIAFANELINDIKNINLDDKATLVDINKSGDRFEIKKYRTAVDMLKGNYEYRETTVDKHIVNPLLDVLLAIEKTLSVGHKQKLAEYEQRYNKMGRLLEVRREDFLTRQWPCPPLDVRHNDASTNYKPMDWSSVSGVDKNGQYWSVTTIGRY